MSPFSESKLNLRSRSQVHYIRIIGIYNVLRWFWSICCKEYGNM